MSIQGRFQSTYYILQPIESIRSIVFAADKHTSFIVPLFFSAVFLLAGCVSDKMDDKSVLVSYQQILAEQGYQQRVDTEGKDLTKPLGLLRPVSSTASNITDVEIITDPNTGRQNVALTIEQALARTLSNSPEIRVVSLEPTI